MAIQQLGHLPSPLGGVFFHGPRCAACSVGEACAFFMRVLPPAGWHPSAHPWQREVRVVLRGPALALATAIPVHPHDGSLFKISYQVWDAGTYRWVGVIMKMRVSQLKDCENKRVSACVRA